MLKALLPAKVEPLSKIAKNDGKVEDWLNKTLIDCKLFQDKKKVLNTIVQAAATKTAPTLDLKPLQVLGVDKASLDADGISRDNVRNVHRKLYAQTTSFHEMLKEITVNVGGNKGKVI